MKVFALVVPLCLAAAAVASTVPAASLTHDVAARMSRKCNVNICWAFDGSGSINAASFKAQKNFANLLGSTINFGFTPTKMGAVQYATIVRPVLSLTSRGETFVNALQSMRQLNGATNIDGGLFGCRITLSGTQNQARHIIMLTDGSASIGAPGFRQAEDFRKSGGLVSIIAAGRFQNPGALRRLAGSSGKVYNVNSFTDAERMFAISQDLGARVCRR